MTPGNVPFKYQLGTALCLPCLLWALTVSSGRELTGLFPPPAAKDRESCVEAQAATPKPEPKAETPAVESAAHPQPPLRVLAASVDADEVAKLAAPANPRPAQWAGLRKGGQVTLRWQDVDGAARYHVRAWQFSGNKQVVLIDESLEETELSIEPIQPTTLFWEVAGIDSAGVSGRAAGPFSVELRPVAAH